MRLFENTHLTESRWRLTLRRLPPRVSKRDAAMNTVVYLGSLFDNIQITLSVNKVEKSEFGHGAFAARKLLG